VQSHTTIHHLIWQWFVDCLNVLYSLKLTVVACQYVCTWYCRLNVQECMCVCGAGHCLHNGCCLLSVEFVPICNLNCYYYLTWRLVPPLGSFESTPLHVWRQYTCWPMHAAGGLCSRCLHAGCGTVIMMTCDMRLVWYYRSRFVLVSTKPLFLGIYCRSVMPFQVLWALGQGLCWSY